MPETASGMIAGREDNFAENETLVALLGLPSSLF